jgi:ribonucleoside-diphosphate reductase alpha chain
MTVFDYDYALSASAKYFDGDDLAAKAFVDKYALRNSDGQLLEATPDALHDRLASEFARIEEKYPNPVPFARIRQSMDRFKYIVPQGSPMAAIGNNYHLQTVGNCYVIQGPADSFGGIHKTDEEEAQIMKRRGGVGFDISNIRPKGLPTKNTARTTDGIGVFMEQFSDTCRRVAQGGRRGALLLTIDCHHPEILTFIKIKQDLKRVTGANISIRWSNEFLTAVENQTTVQLRFPVQPNLKKYLVDVNVPAAEIWNEFVAAAHGSAEPGCLFWDTVLERSPADIYADQGFRTISGNPCGEILMSADSCRLLLLNAFSFVVNPFAKNAYFDFDLFADYVKLAQRLMDDLVDIELEKIDQILKKINSDPEDEEMKSRERNLWLGFRQACVNGRRTGLGLTAIGDTMAALGLKYGSRACVDAVEAIYKSLCLNSYKTSCELAKERGAFPIYDFQEESGHPFIEQIYKADPEIKKLAQKFGRRNIAITTTAPCGTVSLMTQTSSGIEPVFMLRYKRRKKINPSDTDAKVDFVDALGDKWQEFIVQHHGFMKWQQVSGKTEVEDSPYYQSTANEISWTGGVDVQAAAQKWVCHAISRTTNLPANATIEDVHSVYWRGWKSGCKGMTVYRDGCRSGVLVSDDAPETDAGGRPTKIIPTHAPKRPEELPCDIHHVSIKGQKWVILVGILGEKPYEMFAGAAEQLVLPTKMKSGRIKKVKQGHYNLHLGEGEDEMVVKNIVRVFDNPEFAWATRVISMSLRHGVDVAYICDQLNKEGLIIDTNKVMARVLKKYLVGEARGKCDSCGSTNIIFEESCKKCLDCGIGKCG